MEIGTDTVYFTLLGLPFGIALSLLPIMPASVRTNPSSPHGLPVLELLLMGLLQEPPLVSSLDYSYLS